MSTPQPASRVEAFQVTCPAGVAIATPREIATTIDPGTVNRIEVDIPDGHNGVTGLRLAVAHGQVIPATTGAWIIGNDDHLAWDLYGHLDSGAWSAFVYNLGNYSHSWFVRFHVLPVFAELGAGAAPALVPVPIIAL